MFPYRAAFPAIVLLLSATFSHHGGYAAVPDGYEIIASCADWGKNKTQGYNGWRYGYSTTAQNFGAGPSFSGSAYYTQHNAQYRLPTVSGCSGGCQVRKAALQWTSSVTDSLIMRGYVRYSGSCGNGIDAHIFNAGKGSYVLNNGNLGGTQNFDFTLDVDEGDSFIFSFGCGPNIGQQWCWCDGFTMAVDIMAPIPTTTTSTTTTTTTTSTTSTTTTSTTTTSTTSTSTTPEDSSAGNISGKSGGINNGEISAESSDGVLSATTDDDDTRGSGEQVDSGVWIGAGVAAVVFLLGCGLVLFAVAKKRKRTRSGGSIGPRVPGPNLPNRAKRASQGNYRSRRSTRKSIVLPAGSDTVSIGPVYAQSPTDPGNYVQAPQPTSVTRTNTANSQYQQSAYFQLDNGNQYQTGMLTATMNAEGTNLYSPLALGVQSTATVTPNQYGQMMMPVKTSMRDEGYQRGPLNVNYETYSPLSMKQSAGPYGTAESEQLYVGAKQFFGGTIQ